MPALCLFLTSVLNAVISTTGSSISNGISSSISKSSGSASTTGSITGSGFGSALGFDLEKENWDEMSNTFIKAFLAEPSTNLFDWTIPTLTYFRERGIGMSVVSAAEQNTLTKTVDQYGILHYFDNIVGLTDHGAGSKAENAKRLIKQLNIAPNEIILVGDTSHDKEVADFVGCNCILVESGYESRERLLKNGTTVLPSIKELTTLFD